MVLRFNGDHDRAASVGGREPTSPPPPPDSGIQSVALRDDDTILTSSTAGDLPSFDELYREHFAYVWKSARRLGVSAAEVDDVVQETFLTVHRLIDRYAHRGSDRAWLFSVLFRIVQRHHRSNRRKGALTEGGADVDALPGPSERGPERTAETKETARLLENILDSLEPEKRAVLVLADLEERTVAEIADILGLNPNTAASRLRAAREHVEAALARHQARDRWRHK